jgi:hypothetical protein
VAANTLTAQNLMRYWIPKQAWVHGMVLGPMLSLHDALRLKRLKGGSVPGFRWEWTDCPGVEKTLAVIWSMTGCWKARRAVTVRREEFEEVTAEVVPRLSRFLNRQGICSLWDLADTDTRTYARVVSTVHEAVACISRVRPTRETEPVFGSKVLHHFFPSVVPVFDTALIRNGVMRTVPFREFVKGDNEWITYGSVSDAGGGAMLEFHHYFAMCAQLGGSNHPSIVKNLRKRLGNGFRSIAPVRMVDDKKSLLWRLDAKVAEYCLTGQAHKEGLLE